MPESLRLIILQVVQGVDMAPVQDFRVARESDKGETMCHGVGGVANHTA